MEIGQFINNSGFDNQLSKKNYTDAGLDLACDLSKQIKLYTKAGQIIIEDPELDEIILPAFSRIVLNTSVNVAVPYGQVGLIWDRSGLAANYGITTLAGCVDCGYVGDVKVVLFNSSYEDYVIHNNDRIAQLITVPINLHSYRQVDELDETTRGSKGFGDSGC